MDKKIKLSWICKGRVDKFKILRHQAKIKEVCAGCPLSLKEIAIVKDKPWFDVDIKPGYIYWYQVCPVYKGNTGICSEQVKVSISSEQAVEKIIFSRIPSWSNKSKILSAGTPEANRIVFEK